MNRVVLALLSVFALLGASVSVAEVRIAFVNTARVLEQAPQAKAAHEKLEQEFAPRDGELAAEQRRLKSMDERLARDGALMSEEERRKLEREVFLLQRELKRAREAFTEDLNLRRNEEFAKLQRVVFDVVVRIAKESKYDLVFESGVVYASEPVDITNRVIERLREQFNTKR